MEAFNRSAEFEFQYFCRECQSSWYRENRDAHIANVNANSQRYTERNRAFVLKYLRSHPCVDCGESEVGVLEFDHVAGKAIEVSRLVRNASLDRLIDEIQKCQVRCANCHMRRTAEQLRWRKSREAPHEDVFDMRG